MNTIPPYFNDVLIHLVMITVFSLIIGLSQKHLRDNDKDEYVFGTDRTFTFIGIMGFVLFILDRDSKLFFMTGAIILSLFLGIHYYHKWGKHNKPGLTSVMVALLTYFQAAVLITQPIYVYLTYIVIILIFSELKEKLTSVSQKFDKTEFITVAKFILIAGIILPLLPDKPIVSYLTITPYKIWLAVVVISSISYVSYLLRKFVFKNAGLLLVGILGGLYSSTATTVVLSRKSKSMPEQSNEITAGILLAQSMMYVRIIILVYIFNKTLAQLMVPYLLILAVIAAASGILLYYLKGSHKQGDVAEVKENKNPLEFNVALLFTGLYILFTFVNHFAIKTWGTDGLHILALIVGVADIDPFLLNMFQGKYEIALSAIASSSLLAIVSNNFLKMFYAISLFAKKQTRWLIVGFLAIIVVNILFVIIV
ncbi:MgtC/SapB family protein [Saccharicrinis sp. FJH62]|uniref:MgtC/SapB family protein n=1 Tax=Saccharicrinis sp. FJH62 TaxID=3344657 RepID=UPI0035D3EB0D